MKVGFFGGKFLPPHKGHESVIEQARKDCDRLYVVLFHSRSRDESLFVGGKMEYISARLRLRWLKQSVREMENVNVLSIEDSAPTEETYDWEDGANRIKKLIGKKIDVVYGSEKSYAEIFARLYPSAKYVLIDPKRDKQMISASKIRRDGPYKHWGFLPDPVKFYFVRKVVVVGTESCGKSTLVKKLANAFNTNFVPEFGRIMSDWVGGDDLITPDLFPYIAFGQKMAEFDRAKKANKVLFVDTEAIVTKYYLELYHNIGDNLYNEIAKHQEYDLMLLLKPDVAWVDDGTRSHGDQAERQTNHNRLKSMYDKLKIPYVEVGGSYRDRFGKAKQLVEEILK